jgi:hypothetical protein
MQGNLEISRSEGSKDIFEEQNCIFNKLNPCGEWCQFFGGIKKQNLNETVDENHYYTKFRYYLKACVTEIYTDIWRPDGWLKEIQGKVIPIEDMDTYRESYIEANNLLHPKHFMYDMRKEENEQN